jgi:hypothetical protein
LANATQSNTSDRAKVIKIAMTVVALAAAAGIYYLQTRPTPVKLEPRPAPLVVDEKDSKSATYSRPKEAAKTKPEEEVRGGLRFAPGGDK